jgi:OPA family sugar phosphate sensor protein UhpC-like MFS transporter
MGNPLVAFFETGPDRPLLPGGPAAVDRLYARKRLSVFLSVTFGYGLFYTTRINFSVVKKPLLEGGILTATQMGLVGSALLLVYSVGKLVNGFLADRCNIARFMSTALLLSALVNVALGFNTAFAVFLGLWALNGWFQSIGSAPSVVALSHWFARKERGTRYGIWSASHSIGEGLTFAGTAALVAAWGWRWGFLGPGLACVAGALVLYHTIADRPQTLGLPPIGEHKGEPAEEAGPSIGTFQKQVVRHPGVWMLACANAFLSVARYGMANWGPLYLSLAKDYSGPAAGGLLAIYPVAEIAGSVSSGFVSDRFFGARRNAPALIYGLLEVGSLLALLVIPAGHPWLDGAALAVFGFALGGLLVYLGGLMAIDLVSRKAAGAAMGLVGLLTYVTAAGQDTLSGYLIDASKVVVDGVTTYSFGLVFAVWTSALVLSTLCAFSLWIFPRLGAARVEPTPPGPGLRAG